MPIGFSNNSYFMDNHYTLLINKHIFLLIMIDEAAISSVI